MLRACAYNIGWPPIRHSVPVDQEARKWVRAALNRLASRHQPRSASWNRPHWGESDAEMELVALMAETGSSKLQLCDAVAGELALGFFDDSLSYNFCDDLVNVMFGWLHSGLEESTSPGFPDFFMRVYLAGRLKLNGQLRGHSPLSPLVELEGLEAGVSGKRSLWQVLRRAFPADARLEQFHLTRSLRGSRSSFKVSKSIASS